MSEIWIEQGQKEVRMKRILVFAALVAAMSAGAASDGSTEGKESDAVFDPEVGVRAEAFP